VCVCVCVYVCNVCVHVCGVVVCVCVYVCVVVCVCVCMCVMCVFMCLGWNVVWCVYGCVVEWSGVFDVVCCDLLLHFSARFLSRLCLSLSSPFLSLLLPPPPILPERNGMTPLFTRHMYERGVERMGFLLGEKLFNSRLLTKFRVFTI
jgi:hypothetical protein